jgi:hypothetical protein
MLLSPLTVFQSSRRWRSSSRAIPTIALCSARARRGPIVLVHFFDNDAQPGKVCHPEMEETPLLTEPVLAIVPEAHPLAGREDVGLAELAGERFIAEPAADHRPLTLVACHMRLRAAGRWLLERLRAHHRAGGPRRRRRARAAHGAARRGRSSPSRCRRQASRAACSPRLAQATRASRRSPRCSAPSGGRQALMASARASARRIYRPELALSVGVRSRHRMPWRRPSAPRRLDRHLQHRLITLASGLRLCGRRHPRMTSKSWRAELDWTASDQRSLHERHR